MKIETPRPSVDQALMDLVLQKMDKYQINSSTNDIDIKEEYVDEVFELTMDVLGETKRNRMSLLPKEKKLVLIRQLAVLRLKLDSTIPAEQNQPENSGILCRDVEHGSIQSRREQVKNRTAC